MRIGKAMKIILISALCIVLIVAGGIYYLNNATDRDCEILTRISKDPILSKEIWDQMTFYYDQPQLLSELGRKSGVVYVVDIDDSNFDIDWDKIGIPLRHVAFEIKGKNMDYRNISPENVEEVRVGFGYRSHLVYSITNSNKTEDQRYKLSVECKN